MFSFSNKDRLQLQLNIIHNNTAKEEEVYLAAIRANIHQKWDATLAFIDTIKADPSIVVK